MGDMDSNRINRSRQLDIMKANQTRIGTLGTELLAGMLGQLHALFEPAANPWPSSDQVRWQRRQRFLKGSDWLPGPPAGMLDWSNPGQGAAGRQRVVRAFGDLEAKGLVHRGVKSAGLTAEGIVAARYEVGNIQLETCLPGLDFLLSQLGTDAEWRDGGDGGYISECSLAGYDPMPPGKVGACRLPDSAAWAVDALVPLAVAGLIDHDFKPRFELPLYHLTAEGRTLAEERLAAGIADPDAWMELAHLVIKAPDANAEAAYCAAWARSINELTNAKPLNTNCIAHGPSLFLWPNAVLKRIGQPRIRKPSETA